MRIASDKELRRVASIEFCYLCGARFSPSHPATRDHVPPKNIFAGADRLDPLILPVHNQCNQDESGRDESMGQLLAVSHGKRPRPERRRIGMTLLDSHGSSTPYLALTGVDIVGAIARWIRAFHTALYLEFLPNQTPCKIHPPFPRAKKEKGQIVPEKGILVQHPLFVEVVSKNRTAGKTDRISCYNRKCLYECAWEQDDSGNSMCIFALQVYDWKKLADSAHFPSRGCVGFYQPASGRPKTATPGIVRTIEIPVRNPDRLDAFG